MFSQQAKIETGSGFLFNSIQVDKLQLYAIVN